MKKLIHQLRLLLAEMFISAAIGILSNCPEGMVLMGSLYQYYEKIEALRKGNGE